MRLIHKILSLNQILDLRQSSQLCIGLNSREIWKYNLVFMFFKIMFVCCWKKIFSYRSSFWPKLRIFWLNFAYIFIIQGVKARAIPCHPQHQPPARGDNTISIAQGGTATPGTTKQLLPPDRVIRELYIYIYIYIYTPDQLRRESTLDVNLHF